MTDPYGTEPMFEVPKKYRAPEKLDDGKVVWRSYSGKRTSCDDCIVALMEGRSFFLAEPARFTRTVSGQVRYYCNRHSLTRRGHDGQ